MQEFLKDLPQKAKDKYKEHTKFFQRLKKRPPKHLDATMQEIHDKVFSEVNCMSCANCCKTTGPLFTQRDISRISKYLKMKPQQFIQTYLRTDEDQDLVLQQLPCPFLHADNSCSIYEVRPKACAEYPHTDRRDFHKISKLTMKNIPICPAAYKVVEAMQQRMP